MAESMKKNPSGTNKTQSDCGVWLRNGSCGRTTAALLAALFMMCTVAMFSQEAKEQRNVSAKKAAIPADGKIRHSTKYGYDAAYMPIIFPSSHASNLVLLKNGDVLCTWFSGTQEGKSDVAIVVARLPHGARQWTKPEVVDHQPGKSYQNPVLFQAPDGRVWIFHTEQTADEGQANASVLFVTSDDNGETWTKPKELFKKPGAFDRQPLVIVSKEKWLLPMYYTPSRGIKKGAESNYSVVEITTDAGKSWKECEIPGSSGLVQPSVVPVGGHYIAFLRSRFADWIYRSTSDNGCDWSAPVATKLPNNNASIQVARLQDGHLVIAFNNVNATAVKGKPTTGPRVPLSVALSEDGGMSWPWVRDLEKHDPEFDKQFTGVSDKPGREEYSYPSITQLPSGKIGSAYTFRRETIKFVEFDENWIKGGGTEGKYKGEGK